jgi:hypothetical protein
VSGKLKETLFVATSRRAPLNAKLPLAAWARFLFSRPQRSGEETRHKKELRKHLSFRKRAGPNFFRLSGNRVLKTAFVLRDGPLDPPAPHPSEVRPFEPWCQQHRGSLHLRLRLRLRRFGIPHSLGRFAASSVALLACEVAPTLAPNYPGLGKTTGLAGRIEVLAVREIISRLTSKVASARRQSSDPADRLAGESAAGGGCGRSSAISRRISWNIWSTIVHLARRAQTLQDARKPMHTDPSTI